MIKSMFNRLKEKYKKTSVKRLMYSLLGMIVVLFIVSFSVIIASNWILVYRINNLINFQLDTNRVIVNVMQDFNKTVYSVNNMIKSEDYQDAKHNLDKNIENSIKYIDDFLKEKRRKNKSQETAQFYRTFLDFKSYLNGYRAVYGHFIEKQRELNFRKIALDGLINSLNDKIIEIKLYISRVLTEPGISKNIRPYYQQALSDTIILSYEVKRFRNDLFRYIDNVDVNEKANYNIRHNIEKLRFKHESIFLNVDVQPQKQRDIFNLLDSIEKSAKQAVNIARSASIEYKDATFYYSVIENMEYGLNQDISNRIIILQKKLIRLRNYVLIGVFTFLGLSITFLFIFIFVLKNRVFYPLGEFINAIKLTSKGKRDIFIRFSNDDEFNLLADHFNKMARAIKKREDELIHGKEIVELKSKELESIKRYIEDIIHASPNAILTVDEKLRVLFINKRAMSIIKEKNIIGKRLTDIDCTIVNFLNDIKEVLENEREKILSKRELTFPEMGKRVVNIYIYPLHTVNGIGAVIEVEDITEKVVMEEKMLESQKMETVGLLAGGFAHDFNNLLTGLMGYVELAMMSKQHDKTLKYLQRVKDISLHASRLIQQILLFSRADTGRKEIIDLGVVMESALSMIKSPIKKDIRLTKEIEKGLNIYGDASQITQAILNLIINSYEAVNGKKDGCIRIVAEKITGNSKDNSFLINGMDYVKITIEDNGVGMSEEIRERIFEPFFTTKTRGNIKGTGLGLSIVYRVIKNHDGDITVTSKEGEGTRFDIYLPIKQNKKMLKSRKFFEKNKYGSGKVLLVDDEDMIRDVGKEILEHLGYEVITLRNGKECVNFFKEKREAVDLIIMDLIMPEMDGPETLKELSKMGIKIPVLIASGYITLDMSYLKDYDYIKGMIRKPYSIEEISLKLSKILNKG